MLLLLLLVLQLLMLLRGSRPWLRTRASTTRSDTSKALFVLLPVWTLGRLCSLDAGARCDRVLSRQGLALARERLAVLSDDFLYRQGRSGPCWSLHESGRG